MKIESIYSNSEENLYLQQLVELSGISVNWTQITTKFNLFFPSKTKTEPQCQSMYLNSLPPTTQSQTNNNWLFQQTKLLFTLFELYGSKWTKIAQKMNGKTESSVKNRFYGSLRKVLRKLNKSAKTLTKKFKKQLKYESITRIIDASYGIYRLFSPLKQESQKLTQKIISFAKRTQQDIPLPQIEQLIHQINKFNMSTRSYKSIKKIKNQGIHSKKKKLYETQNYNNKSSLIKSTDTNYNNIKIQINIDSKTQPHTQTTQQQSSDYVSNIIGKCTTSFLQQQQNKLRDYQMEEQQHQKTDKLCQSVEDLLNQSHSHHLESNLWI